MKKNKKVKKFFNTHLETIVFVLAMLIGIFLITHILVLGKDYSSSVEEQAERKANSYMQEQSVYIQEQLSFIKSETEYYSYKITNCTESEFLSEMANLRELGSVNGNFVDLCYFKGDNLLLWNGVTEVKYDEMLELKGSTDTRVSRVFYYDERMQAISVYSKTDGLDFCDGVVTIYDSAILSLDSFSEEQCVKNSEFTILIKSDGKIIARQENSKNFTLGNESVQEGIIKNIFQNFSESEKVTNAIRTEGIHSFSFRSGMDEYFFSISCFGDDDGSLALISVYSIDKIYGEGYEVVQNIWLTVFGITLIITIIMVTVIINRVNNHRKIKRMELVDETLNCGTPKRFKKVVAEMLAHNKSSDFACISLIINYFKYIGEAFGEEARTNLLKFVAENIRRSLSIEETFAYAQNGEFLLFLRNPKSNALETRLNGLYIRISSFDGFINKEYKISVSLSVYEIEKEERENIDHIAEKLRIVKETSTINQGAVKINFYKDAMQENYLKRAEVEGRMENALKNSEFHLFYQPKYNLKAKKMDGSEILVRWYDPKIEQYRVPDEFIPIFESNGFIVKMDHFVFFKACENIRTTIDNKKICYPISVNVSRVTAIQPDFADYYIRIKNKFNIKDNFITLEFTESFAYENYTVISELISTLHENGFLCSIDDFGTGYSSYNLLKNISVDEIKLDKFFLEKGYSKDRDNMLLASVVKMVKDFGIKITQEGIETEEDFRRLEELGCDVIQGYYFAKPMKFVDYREFVEKNFG